MAYIVDEARCELTNSGSARGWLALQAAREHAGLMIAGGLGAAERLVLKLWGPGVDGTYMAKRNTRLGNNIIRISKILSDQDEELKVWRVKFSKSAMKFDIVSRHDDEGSWYLRFPLYHHSIDPLEVVAREDPTVALGFAWRDSGDAKIYIHDDDRIIAYN